MKHCTGQLNKVCTCGEYHDVPEAAMFASPWFWIGGALSVLVWTAVCAVWL